jgi:hypothetical protein
MAAKELMRDPFSHAFLPYFEVGPLHHRVAGVLSEQPECLAEFRLLLRRARDDRRMAMVRGRIIMEWVVGRRLAMVFGTSYHQELLRDRISRLTKCAGVSPVLSSLANWLRRKGNSAAHYCDDPSRNDRFSWRNTVNTVGRVAELLEREFATEWKVFSESLPEPHRSVYDQFLRAWQPALGDRRGSRFSLFGIVDLALRNALTRMAPACFDLLVKYQQDGNLAAKLPHLEEVHLRRMRNLGLIETADGGPLFTPVRNSKIRLTGTGDIILALLRRQSAATVEIDEVVHQVEQRLAAVSKDKNLVAALAEVERPGCVTPDNKAVFRKLRNLNLLTHSAILLRDSKRVWLTEFGDYILGQETPDHI